MSRIKHMLLCQEEKETLENLSLKKKKKMAKVQCYGCQEYGHYRRNCHKLIRDNNKRNKEEAHINKEVEDLETKKPKKEEVKDLYYD